MAGFDTLKHSWAVSHAFAAYPAMRKCTQFMFYFSSDGVCHFNLAVIRQCNPLCVCQDFPASPDYTLIICPGIVWKWLFWFVANIGSYICPCGTMQVFATAISDTHQTFVYLLPTHSGYYFPIDGYWGLLAKSSWWGHCVSRVITTDSRFTDVTKTQMHKHSLLHSLSAHAQ